MFKEQQCQKLQERLSFKQKQWDVANDQLDSELNAAQKPIIEKQIDSLEKEIEQLGEEIAKKCEPSEETPPAEVDKTTVSPSKKEKRFAFLKWVLAALVVPIIAALLSRSDIPLFWQNAADTETPEIIFTATNTPGVDITATLESSETSIINTATFESSSTLNNATETPTSTGINPLDAEDVVIEVWHRDSASIRLNASLQQISETHLSWLQGQSVQTLESDEESLYVNNVGISIETVARNSYNYVFPLDIYVYIGREDLSADILREALIEKLGSDYLQYNEYGFASDNNLVSGVYYAVLLLGQHE